VAITELLIGCFFSEFLTRDHTGLSDQPREDPAVQNYILTRQVTGVSAARERGESTKFFGLAKTTGRNRAKAISRRRS